MRNSRNERRFYYSILRIILSIFLLFVSFIAINYIVNTIIHYPYLTSLVLKDEADTPRINITIDNNKQGESIFIQDDRGIRFRKEDKSFARDEWIDKNGELFYFDASSYGKNGDMRYDGQIYTFEKGKLIRIQKDKNFTKSDKNEFFNSRDGAQFLSYLDVNNKENNNYPIRVFNYNDETDDFLGSNKDKQYCSENLMKINNNTIYYLAIGNTSYTGILNRMRPNAEMKETIGTNVVGYIVLSDDVIYYYNGNIVVKANNWQRVSIDYSEVDENEIFNSAPLDVSDNAPNVIIGGGPGVNIDKEKTPIIIDNNIEPTANINKEEAIIGRAPGSINDKKDNSNINTNRPNNKMNDINIPIETTRDFDNKKNERIIVSTESTTTGPIIDAPVPLPRINALPR